MEELDLTKLDQIEGTVVSVIYQNPENGYTVMRLDTPEGVVTAVGCMPGIAPGETIMLTGQWTTHQSYGEQFKAEWCERRMPVGREAIYRYLASGAIKHIGPARARDIVQKFGDDTLEIMENNPELLAEVKGVSKKSAKEIGVWFRRQVGLRRLMEFLSKYAIKPNVAVSLYKNYADDALDAVRNNPYIMVSEDFGAEFFEADNMALNMGFEADCPERIEAAVLFELRHNLNNGHTFLPREKLINATCQLISVPQENAVEALEALNDGGYIVQCPVANVDACYLAEIYEDEQYVSEKLTLMVSIPSYDEKKAQKLARDVEKTLGITYAEHQKQALITAAQSRVMVLTGGPGTGKTTAVKGILKMFESLGLDVELCAPTGRASKRMGEVTDHSASTIHRLLGTNMGENDRIIFEHNENDPIDCDAVIIDETSMVDISLMHALLAALKPNCRLIMVGDADQLPSVGPGNVFSDIIRSEVIPTVTLTEIFRQSKQSFIVRNAHMINRGEVPDLKANTGDFFMLRRTSAQKTAETIVQLCAHRLPENMGIDPSQIQVLSPTRKYDTGTENLNIMLQTALNPPQPGKHEKIFGDYTFREGDRVMQIRNNYDIIWHKLLPADEPKQESYPSFADEDDEDFYDVANNPAFATDHAGTGVYNGDIGIITQIDNVHETLRVDFEDRYVTYTFDQLNELEPAYAMTVHKSQGSEYRAVILAAFDGAPKLLVRSVLYTAVTRARELLIIVGDDGVVSSMTMNDRRQRRYSGLRYLLFSRKK